MRVIWNDNDPYLQEMRAQAAQQVIRAFTRAITYNRDQDAASALAARALDGLSTAAPLAWGREAAHRLAEAIRQLHHDLGACKAEIGDLKWTHHALQEQVDAYQAHPLQTQLEQAAADRDRWQALATEQKAQLAALREQLDGGAQFRQFQAGEIDRLQDEIRALNRIVAEQQEKLIGDP